MILQFFHARSISRVVRQVRRGHCKEMLSLRRVAADVMVDAHKHVSDVAASQVLIEEARGAYSIVRDFVAPGGRLLTVVFGRPSIVAAIAAMFDESGGARPRG